MFLSAVALPTLLMILPAAHAAKKPKTAPKAAPKIETSVEPKIESKAEPQTETKTVVAAPTATASWQDRLALAERTYDDYRYTDAIPMFTALLADPSFTDGPARQKARALLAFSYYISQKEPEAAAELDRLFRENVDYPLDRDATHPDVLKFYDNERNRYVASLNTKPVEVQKTEARKAEAPANETIGDRHKWVRIFPGGIGHFLNHDYAGGAAFLALEVALGGTNLAMALLREGLKAPDGKYRQGTNPSPYQWVMNVAALTAFVVIIIDVIDAFVWSPARGRESLQKSLTTDLGPLGEYRLVFGL